MVAWDGPPTTSPQLWIGQFFLPDDSTLYSKPTDWFYTVGSGNNPLDNGDPVLGTISRDFNLASWTSIPQASAPNGTGPWGSIPGFDPSAQFIWADNLGGASNFDNTYVIFRTKAAVVPIPGSVLLLGTGLLGLGLLGRRRQSR